jgi:hypothetical protein
MWFAAGGTASVRKKAMGRHPRARATQAAQAPPPQAANSTQPRGAGWGTRGAKGKRGRPARATDTSGGGLRRAAHRKDRSDGRSPQGSLGWPLECVITHRPGMLHARTVPGSRGTQYFPALPDPAVLALWYSGVVTSTKTLFRSTHCLCSGESRCSSLAHTFEHTTCLILQGHTV